MSNINKQEKEPNSQERKPLANPPPTVIWEVIDAIMSGLPDEVLDRLPADGAERHDDYLRGERDKIQQES
jgi:hypothetical protein